MCLTIDRDKTEALKRNGKEYTRYKVILKINENNWTEFYQSYFQDFNWTTGWNIAKRLKNDIRMFHVYDGAIHVFITEESAQKFMKSMTAAPHNSPIPPTKPE